MKTTIARSLLVLMLVGAVGLAFPAVATAQSTFIPLIPRTEAERHGLTRAWFTQVPLDQARSKINYLTFQSGLLLVVTDEGMLHVIDAESGLLQWSFEAGEHRLVTLAAGANATHVAIVNGTTLHVLDRNSGSEIFHRQVTGIPDRGPVLTEHQVVIPLVLGPLESYPLNIPSEKVLYPRYLDCPGRLLGNIATYGQSLAWTTDQSRLRGYQFADEGIDFTVRVRGKTDTSPAVFWPNIYVGTTAGYVIAYDMRRGSEIWEFTAGEPIRRKPVAIGPVVYVFLENGGMFSLQSETGGEQWFAPDPMRFIAASPERVYTVDKLGWLEILDSKNGMHVDDMWMPFGLKPILNDQSDRLYLYTDKGLIQCLRETQRDQPLHYAPEKPKDKPKGPAAAPQAEPAAATPAAAAAPK